MISEFGWKQSDLAEQLERANKLGWLEFFKEASNKVGMPLGLLLAISSRETNIRNIKGDGGHGRGLMQIDDRYHQEFLNANQGGMDPKSNINYGAGILAANFDRAKKAIEDPTNRMRAVIAGYNASINKTIDAIRAGKDPDQLTKNKNYSRDVLARAAIFNQLLNQGA